MYHATDIMMIYATNKHVIYPDYKKNIYKKAQHFHSKFFYKYQQNIKFEYS